MNFETMLAVFALNFIACHTDDADRDLADWSEPDINDEIKENIGSTTCQKYPIIIPANLVIEICLKDTMLPNKLEGNDECGDDYKCVFAKIIAHDSMKSLVLLLKNETTGKVDQEFKRAAHDCVIWWKLIRTINANLNGPNELAKCLFQSFALKCKKTVLDKVKERLISKMKNLTYLH